MSQTSFLSELSLYDINLYLQLGYKTENTGQASTTLFNMTDEPSPDCFLWPPASGCSPAISGVRGRYVQRKKGVLYLSLTKLQKHSSHRSL